MFDFIYKSIFLLNHKNDDEHKGGLFNLGFLIFLIMTKYLNGIIQKNIHQL